MNREEATDVAVDFDAKVSELDGDADHDGVQDRARRIANTVEEFTKWRAEL